MNKIRTPILALIGGAKLRQKNTRCDGELYPRCLQGLVNQNAESIYFIIGKVVLHALSFLVEVAELGEMTMGLRTALGLKNKRRFNINGIRHHIDSCSVYRGMVNVVGWSESGPPDITYRGEHVPSQTFARRREDVAEAMGPGAEHWGFRLSAILPDDLPSHDAISLVFPNGTIMAAPGSKFRTPLDDIGRMTERFKAMTKQGDTVLEIGSRARSGNTYRDMVHEGASYTGIDVANGPNVDVVGDAHHLSRYVQGPFNAIFSISVFEHLLMPWKVALEMNKVMRTGAVAYIQSHPAWPLHEEPWDFWRFSKDAWSGLFNAHTGFRLLDSGYAMGALVVPDFAAGSHLQGLDGARTYLLSACLVEKSGDPLVSWEAEASDVYDLAYDH